MTELSVNAEQTAKPQLTMEETREVLTPFAFKVDENLYGTPLAKSSKRCMAMLVDLMLVSLLSSTSGEFLALVFAITFFRLGSNKRAEELGRTTGKKRRFIMRVIAALTLFIALSQILPTVLSWINDDKSNVSVKLNTANIKTAEFSDLAKLGIEGLKIVNSLQESECKDAGCWQKTLKDTPKHMVSLGLTNEEAEELLTELTKKLPLSEDENNQVLASLKADYKTEKAKQLPKEVNNKTSAISEAVKEEKKKAKEPKETKDKGFEYSVIEQIKSLINDLGVGFGWAAFYFTVFTALWNGQTPGKKMFGIRVMQLDGTPLSMMDSFGRYGGYGAGLATGLLGFLQILWDPNRQAIQDKISSTVVVDDNSKVSKSLINAVHDGDVEAAK